LNVTFFSSWKLSLSR